MRFSLVNNIRIEAQPGLKGICVCCGSDTIAKCGNYKVWHWAHCTKQKCDHWWENETEWHRKWKSFFPIECQELIHKDEITGKKHIADVKTKNGVVIEFQNSPIKPEEIISRERFYEKMFWIVNGDVNTNKFYFNLGLEEKISESPSIYTFNNFGSRSSFFKKWSLCSCPVFIDFIDFIDFFEMGLLWKLLEYDSNSKKGKLELVNHKELITRHGGNIN
ncbi:competence protein CoiA family protein [Anabaena cylindrica UHCC 0172]|uniref:competence protein CoiA n=1 Tax=Anabaena cylindrica TaxID=1165 RepID=UPI002B21D2DC|nr:competence protein CoiA family protein [Anabaena cylindrica]MEA5550267.1 competence protein CoiA family protein [Anabaena cylindrica UHCC 0172]